MQGRYFELYTKQQGLQNNLFLAPGEGDVPVTAEDGLPTKNGERDVSSANALRLIRGEVR